MRIRILALYLAKALGKLQPEFITLGRNTNQVHRYYEINEKDSTY